MHISFSINSKILFSACNEKMENISSRFCDICLRKNIRINVRTICEECRELYCQHCSDTHLLQRATEKHTLIDLIPSHRQEQSRRSTTHESEIEKSSDFLSQFSIKRENVALYTVSRSKEEGAGASRTRTVERHGSFPDPHMLKATKYTDFEMKIPGKESTPSIYNVMVLDNKIITYDIRDRSLNLFKCNGSFLSSVGLSDYLYDITSLGEDEFATIVGESDKMYVWCVDGSVMVSKDISYNVGKYSHISYNGKYFSTCCTIDINGGSDGLWKVRIFVLDKQGRQIRNFELRKVFGLESMVANDIQIEEMTNNTYISVRDDITGKSGILSVSIEGNPLWFFSLTNTRRFTEIDGMPCVTDTYDRCIYLLSKTGQFKVKLIDKEDVNGEPECISYDKYSRKLYVTFSEALVSVYSVNWKD